MSANYDVTEDGVTRRLNDIDAIVPQNGYWVFMRGDLPVRALEQRSGNSFALVDEEE